MNERQVQNSVNKVKTTFNPSASVFEMRSDSIESYPTVAVGPTRVPVNETIWSAVASTRVLPILPMSQIGPHRIVSPPPQRSFMTPNSQQSQPYFSSSAYAGYNHPQFEDDYSRDCIFTRDFGPVALAEGFVELRLREKISILMTLDKSILIQNPRSKVRIAVNHNMTASSMEHPNGKVNQQVDRVDIMTYDGSKKLNNYVRYAKIWDKGISLTADGCALIYLVDTAGTRTTSDAVNKDIHKDYCWQTFITNSRYGHNLLPEVDAVVKNYHFYTKDDGVQVFDILGFNIQQTRDGMVRVSRGNNRLKAHTSPTNGSATMNTPLIHATASMGQSSHLFVRRDERRMHFDGSSFVVRNAGHSSGFDQDNNLRVY